MTKATKPTVKYDGQLYGFDTSARGGGQWRVIGTTGNYGKFLKKEVQNAWGKPISGQELANAVAQPAAASSEAAPSKTNTSVSSKAKKNMQKQVRYSDSHYMNDLLTNLFGGDIADLYSLFFGDFSDIKTGKGSKSGVKSDKEKAESISQELQKETNQLLKENNKILVDLVKFFKEQAAKSDIKGDIKQAAASASEPLERLGDTESATGQDEDTGGGGFSIPDFINPFSRRNRARGRILRRGAGRFISRVAGFGKSVLGGITSVGAGLASNLSVPRMDTMEPIVTPKAPPAAATAAGEAAGAKGAAGAAKSGLKFGSKFLKGLGPIATILGIGATIYELTELKQQLDTAVQSGQMTEAEADKQFKKEAIKAVSGSLGALGGSLAGAALGTMILPIGGTIVGAIAGGVAGGFGGEYLAEKLYDFLDSGKEVDPKELKKKAENQATGGAGGVVNNAGNPVSQNPAMVTDTEEQQGQRLQNLVNKYGLDSSSVSAKREGGVITSISDQSGKQIDVTSSLSFADKLKVNDARKAKAMLEGTTPNLIPVPENQLILPTEEQLKSLQLAAAPLKNLANKYGLSPTGRVIGKQEGGVITSITDQSGKQIDVTPDLSLADIKKVNDARKAKAMLEGKTPNLIPEKRATGGVVNNASTELADSRSGMTSSPIINNVVNNVSGGGGTVSVPGPTSSARNDDSAFRRAQDRLSWGMAQ